MPLIDSNSLRDLAGFGAGVEPSESGGKCLLVDGLVRKEGM
jgi:hypothetical protein